MRCGRPARSGGFRIGGPNFFAPPQQGLKLNLKPQISQIPRLEEKGNGLCQYIFVPDESASVAKLF